MLIERIGDVSVILCDGRIVHSDSAFELRDAVTQQKDARVVLLDLSEVEAMGGGGVGMLVFLQNWTHDHGIQMKLVDPPPSVLRRLKELRTASRLEVASTDEVLSLLHWNGKPLQPPKHLAAAS